SAPRRIRRRQFKQKVRSQAILLPIADRAIDFWKTLSNWINAIKAGQLTLDGTLFRIHVFASKSGTIADSFAAAETDTAAEEAIAAAKNELWGVPPKFPKKADVAKSL